MQHSEIIQAIQKLIPETLEKGPEPVLLKYASEQNLTPAQLERVAQVYNTALTLNFLEKSANRGATFRLVEVPDLLKDYTDPFKEEKKAAVPDDWALWFADDMQKAASESIEAIEDMPDIVARAFGRTEDNFVFEKEIEAYPARISDGFWDRLHKEASDRFETDSVTRMVEEAEDSFRKLASNFERLLTTTDANFAEMEKEARLVHGPGINTSVDILCNYLDQRKIPYTRCEGDTETQSKHAAVIKDKWGTLNDFQWLASHVNDIKAANAYREFIKGAAELNSMHGHPNEQDTPGHPAPAPGPELRGGAAGTDADAPAHPPGEAPAPAGEAAGHGGDEQHHTPQHSNRQPNSGGNGGGRPGGQGGGRNPAPENKDKGSGKGRPEDSPFSAAFNAVGGVFDPSTYIKADPNDMIKQLQPKKNKRQEKIDKSLSDETRVGTLQRLILTDPIISEADPATVVDLANTIAKASPEIAGDINLMRMALREAIQYEAIPLHTFKDIIEMNQKFNSGEKDREAREGTRYAI
jgi:hypothetical protein